MKPLVSAIIPNYNYGRYLGEAVESVLAQTYPNVEVIVVDDGSTDDSLSVLQRFGDQITVISNKNSGVSTARNSGVAASSGKYVAFLDADDAWLPEKIEAQITKFDEDDQVGLVTCAMHYIRPDGTIFGRNDNGLEGWVADDLLCLDKGVVVGAGSTGIIRRSLFEDIGGFDVRLATIADWEICYRAARRQKVGFISTPLALYRIHGSNMHEDLCRTEREAMYCLRKVFASDDVRLAKLKGRAYAKSHLILSGSNFHSRNYSAAVIHGLKAFFYYPRSFRKFIDFFAVRLKVKRKHGEVVDRI